MVRTFKAPMRPQPLSAQRQIPKPAICQRENTRARSFGSYVPLYQRPRLGPLSHQYVPVWESLPFVVGFNGADNLPWEFRCSQLVECRVRRDPQPRTDPKLGAGPAGGRSRLCD